jgi:hypothetical protein
MDLSTQSGHRGSSGDVDMKSSIYLRPEFPTGLQVVFLAEPRYMSEEDRNSSVATLQLSAYGVASQVGTKEFMEALQSGGLTMDLLLIEARPRTLRCTAERRRAPREASSRSAGV